MQQKQQNRVQLFINIAEKRVNMNVRQQGKYNQMKAEEKQLLSKKSYLSSRNLRISTNPDELQPTSSQRDKNILSNSTSHHQPWQTIINPPIIIGDADTLFLLRQNQRIEQDIFDCLDQLEQNAKTTEYDNDEQSELLRQLQKLKLLGGEQKQLINKLVKINQKQNCLLMSKCKSITSLARIIKRLQHKIQQLTYSLQESKQKQTNLSEEYALINSKLKQIQHQKININIATQTPNIELLHTATQNIAITLDAEIQNDTIKAIDYQCQAIIANQKQDQFCQTQIQVQQIEKQEAKPQINHQASQTQVLTFEQIQSQTQSIQQADQYIQTETKEYVQQSIQTALKNVDNQTQTLEHVLCQINTQTKSWNNESEVQTLLSTLLIQENSTQTENKSSKSIEISTNLIQLQSTECQTKEKQFLEQSTQTQQLNLKQTESLTDKIITFQQSNQTHNIRPILSIHPQQIIHFIQLPTNKNIQPLQFISISVKTIHVQSQTDHPQHQIQKISKDILQQYPQTQIRQKLLTINSQIEITLDERQINKVQTQITEQDDKSVKLNFSTKTASDKIVGYFKQISSLQNQINYNEQIIKDLEVQGQNEASKAFARLLKEHMYLKVCLERMIEKDHELQQHNNQRIMQLCLDDRQALDKTNTNLKPNDKQCSIY